MFRRDATSLVPHSRDALRVQDPNPSVNNPSLVGLIHTVIEFPLAKFHYTI